MDNHARFPVKMRMPDCMRFTTRNCDIILNTATRITLRDECENSAQSGICAAYARHEIYSLVSHKDFD